MLARLGGWLTRRRWAVLVLALVFAVVAGVFGGSVSSRLTGGGFTDPGAESAKAEALLGTRFGQSETNFLLLASTPAGVDAAQAVRDGVALTRRLTAQEHVVDVASYWTTHASSLRSRDGRQALVLAHVAGSDTQIHGRVKKLTRAFTGPAGTLRVQVGGSAAVDAQLNTTSEKDLRTAEEIALPVTLALLVLVFGGVIAALLPLVLGVFAILGTFLVLRLIASVTPVSEFALNLTTGLGLGLAIDYSLFVVTRYREQLRAGDSPRTALFTTLTTAGRTVAFSALTVTLAMAALLVFPLGFLRSIAYAGIAVVLMTATAALVVLPALLAVLGPRVDTLTVRRRRQSAPVEHRRWYRVATTVMRHPLPVAGATLAVLLALGTPFLNVHFGLPDDRVLPANAPAHVTSQQIRRNFDARAQSALSIVAPAAASGTIASYAASVSRLPDIVRVDAATGSYVAGRRVAPPGPLSRRFESRQGGTWLSALPDVDPYSAAGQRLVHRIRALPAPERMLVGGPAADLVDTEHALGSRLWEAGLWISAAMLIVLFVFTGSLVLPLQAILLSLLSLTAMFGAMVYVFQEGHLHALLGGFLTGGTLDTTVPILMFCVAFGLSTDYAVFLLSRVKEERAAGRDTRHAVAAALATTGPIVTAAAVIVAVVFVAIGTSSISIIKMLGDGLALAVLIDASLVCGLLLPAFTSLTGDTATWWAPERLRRLHRRIGLSDGERA